jgi:hypothetical protein
MPRQNRVTPFGEIVVAPERGTFMGNRGLLHDERGRIRRPWQLARWIVCLLDFRGRKRQVMTPGLYTELFFLDEATALAAGHRPCAECRRERFDAFRAAWAAAIGGELPRAPEVDGRLHAERAGAGRTKRTFSALGGLPDGTFVTVASWGDEAHLVWRGGLLTWSPGGYTGRRTRPAGGVEVTVLTPASTVAALRAGYVPAVHESATAGR